MEGGRNHCQCNGGNILDREETINSVVGGIFLMGKEETMLVGREERKEPIHVVGGIQQVGEEETITGGEEGNGRNH